MRRRWFGVACLLAGLGLVAFVAWEYVGTTWTSQARHREVVASLEEAWRDGAEVARVDAGTATAVVRIPALGEDYAVPLLEGTSDDALAAGFGHLDGTAAPGAKGNTVIAAHRVTHGEPLRRMPELRAGDEVVLEVADRAYHYVLDTHGDALSVSWDTTWVSEPRPRNPSGGIQPPSGVGARLLTLVTCADLFRTTDRLVAFGHLVSVDRRDVRAEGSSASSLGE